MRNQGSCAEVRKQLQVAERAGAWLVEKNPNAPWALWALGTLLPHYKALRLVMGGEEQAMAKIRKVEKLAAQPGERAGLSC